MDPNLQQFVPDVRFEQIPIKNLVSNQDYQRILSIRHVDRTAENFDIYQINPVKVSRRNGINYVFNGQHTIETVARVSGSRETPVWCMVYEDLDYETEADIFANQMRFTKNLTQYEVFNAHIEAGHQDQLLIKALVESYSLTITNNYSTLGGISAISALQWIYTKYGYRMLDKTLLLCVSTWEGDPLSLTANMLKGIAKLLDCFGDTLKPELFMERLSRISVKEIVRCAKERRNGSMGYAEAMLTFYNKKATKHTLRWSKLYDGNDSTDEDQSDAFQTDDENISLTDTANAQEQQVIIMDDQILASE